MLDAKITFCRWFQHVEWVSEFVLFKCLSDVWTQNDEQNAAVSRWCNLSQMSRHLTSTQAACTLRVPYIWYFITFFVLNSLTNSCVYISDSISWNILLQYCQNDLWCAIWARSSRAVLSPFFKHLASIVK